MMRATPDKKVNLQVRPAVQADLDQILRIAGTEPGLPQWSPAIYQSLLRQEVHPLRRDVLVGAVSGKVVAFGVLSLLLAVSPVVGEVEILAVNPEWRRHGIGKAVLLGLLAAAQASQADVVHLEVRSGNAAAIALYQAGGFVVTGRRLGYYQPPVEDAVLLEVHLHEAANASTGSGIIKD